MEHIEPELELYEQLKERQSERSKEAVYICMVLGGSFIAVAIAGAFASESSSNPTTSSGTDTLATLRAVLTMLQAALKDVLAIQIALLGIVAALAIAVSVLRYEPGRDVHKFTMDKHWHVVLRRAALFTAATSVALGGATLTALAAAAWRHDATNLFVYWIAILITSFTVALATGIDENAVDLLEFRLGIAKATRDANIVNSRRQAYQTDRRRAGLRWQRILWGLNSGTPRERAAKEDSSSQRPRSSSGSGTRNFLVACGICNVFTVGWIATAWTYSNQDPPLRDGFFAAAVAVGVVVALQAYTIGAISFAASAWTDSLKTSILDEGSWYRMLSQYFFSASLASLGPLLLLLLWTQLPQPAGRLGLAISAVALFGPLLTIEPFRFLAFAPTRQRPWFRPSRLAQLEGLRKADAEISRSLERLINDIKTLDAGRRREAALLLREQKPLQNQISPAAHSLILEWAEENHRGPFF